MIDMFGIVNVEDDRVIVEGLSQFRTIPAISFLARYRVIDFVLSNMVNSGIENIKVLIKEKPRSLIEHLGSGTQYNLNSKTGKMQILYPDHQVSNRLYLTDIGLLKQYREYIEESREEYVVIAPSYMICRINYQDVVKQHIESGADVTCVYKEVFDGDKHYLGCTEYEFDENKKVTLIKDSHGSTSHKYIGLNTYVMSKDALLELIDDASLQSSIYSIYDYLKNNMDIYKIYGYQYEGYLACINSLKEYYETNINLINYKKSRELFDKDWPISTVTNDSAPALYTHTAKVKNCIIANGCVIKGTVENCVIGRGVYIESGAVVKNSLILPGALISENSVIDYAVIDKDAKVKFVKKVIGDEDNIMYVRRRDTI